MSTEDYALLTTHLRHLDDLIESGVDPMDLSNSNGVAPVEIEVDVEADDLAEGDRLVLVGQVAPAWGKEPPEVVTGVEFRLVRGDQAVVGTAIEPGSAPYKPPKTPSDLGKLCTCPISPLGTPFLRPSLRNPL